MKHLYILRHAEAVHRADTDKARPLTETGRHAAVSLGLRMKREGLVPDYIFCSPAVRTDQTLELLELGEITTLFLPALYNAPARELYDRIKTAPSSCESVLLVAHNPGVGDLATLLTGEYVSFSPGTLAVIEYNGEDWAALMPKENLLVESF